MNKNDLIRVYPPDPDQLEALEEKFAISYAMIMWKLQEMCGLTYKEARAHLIYHWETEKNFAKDLNITLGSVRKLKRRAARKVRDSGFTMEQIVGKYGAIFRHFVEPDDVFDDDTAAPGKKRLRSA